MNNANKSSRGSGKQQLIDAALTLAAEKRSFSGIGLRELAREAGLNPNTFYRHFASMDDLGVCMVRDIGTRLQQSLSAVMQQPADSRDLIDQSLDQLFAFVLAHPDAFLVAACERYSASPAVRDALEDILQQLQKEVAASAQALKILPSLPAQRLDEITEHIIHYCFRITVDYLEKPDQRPRIKSAARRYIIMLFSGALALEEGGRA